MVPGRRFFFPYMNDFERELEEELHRILDPMKATPIPRRRVNETGGAMHKFLGGLGAAIGVKVLGGFVVAAAAATVAVAATEVASTGSLNPLNWGQRVTHQVTACKASAERLGVHGIGQCVAPFAQTHGDTANDSHGKGKDNANGNGGGNANSHSKAKGANGQGNSSGHGNSGTGTTGPGTKTPETPAAESSQP
ncbi:MAG: hypothetical protein ACREOM_05720 [Candidatus Dormibacteraceae bacterium]